MARAYGKVILVGEHAVVHGTPAIAAGVGVAATAEARVAARSRLSIGERRWEIGGASSAPEARAFRALVEVLAGGPAPEIEADVALQQASGVGLGASAAIAVALARAVSDALGSPAERRPAAEILAAAQAWENVFHGNASGIDAAAAYHGGCLWFRRSAPAEPLRLGATLRLIVAVAGPAVSTRSMVEGVAARLRAEPRRFEGLIGSIGELVVAARAALLGGSLSELGALMNDNHRLLGELGVSTPALDAACQLARDAGALGAKLTGGGGGGCVLALAEAATTDAVLARFRQRGLHCFEASVPAATDGRAPPP